MLYYLNTYSDLKALIKQFEFGKENVIKRDIEIIRLQNYLALKSLVSYSKFVWPLVSKHKIQSYEVVGRLKSAAYLYTFSFSNMKEQSL